MVAHDFTRHSFRAFRGRNAASAGAMGRGPLSLVGICLLVGICVVQPASGLSYRFAQRIDAQREGEEGGQLLTPSWADYLATIDTGESGRLEPSGEARFLLNGHVLTARAKTGILHLMLPRAFITSPWSRLRLLSGRPLRHRPSGWLRRLRPLGEEFVAETLIDDDLMATGFYRPEVRSDGAAWRWTKGVAQILLPGPGSSAPWRRLAARVRGRPPLGGQPQTVTFLLGETKLGEAVLSGDDQTLEFSIPPGAIGRRLFTLTIVTTPWRPAEAPRSRDAREVGVAVYWVGLTRAESFQRLRRGEEAVGDLPAWQPLFGLGRRYRTETASFFSGGLALRGDLLVPLGGGRSAIVLAHGANRRGRKHGLYVGLARRLAEKGYWVLSPDLRGYGESEDPSRVVSPNDLDFTQDLASAVAYLKSRLDVRDLTVVGHSFGAGVAIALGARDPRVDRVVAISPGRRAYERVLGSVAGTRAIRDRMVSEMGLEPEQFPIELVERVVVPMIIDTYAGDPYPRPILLLDGAREEEADLLFLRGIYRGWRGPKAYVTIPDADHYFGVRRQVEERDPVLLQSVVDVVDAWIREGARWTEP